MTKKKLTPAFRPIELKRYRGAPYLEKYQDKVQEHAWNLQAQAQKLLDESERLLEEMYSKGFDDGFAAGMTECEKSHG